MTNLFIPLFNWNLGIAWIIFFAILCVAMAALVFKLVLTGKSKEEIEKEDQEKLRQ